MAHITFVKRILSCGEVCAHCIRVAEQLESDKLTKHIDQVLIADERQADSPGMRMAHEHQVKRMPFFIVQGSSGQTLTFEGYSKFKHYLQQL